MIILFTAETCQKESECDRGMSSVITWVFRKLMGWLLYLMAAAWLCAAIYGISQQMFALKLMVMGLLIAILILLTGLVLLAVLLAIESVAKLLANRREMHRPRQADSLRIWHTERSNKYGL